MICAKIDAAYVGATFSGLEKSAVLSVNPISETIRALGVIMCDVCRQEKAAHDVFVQGPGQAAFLKRCCDQCVCKVN